MALYSQLKPGCNKIARQYRPLILGLAVLFVPLYFSEDACGAIMVQTPADRQSPLPSSPPPPMERIAIAEDGKSFVTVPSGKPLKLWGVNYDHDYEGLLLEDYWFEQWDTVASDFREIKALGANVVRIHLQVSAFMTMPDGADEQANDEHQVLKPVTNAASLKQLRKLVKLAEEVGLYLDITGLGCYHKDDVPAWYDAMSEAQRWHTQTAFWEAIAKVCADSPAIFCYDLMNEPILPGKNKPETEWLAGEFGGKHFVQRITLDLKDRTRKQVARAWVETLTTAIRKHDQQHLITVGIIPWAHTFPGAKPLFYSDEVAADDLDFVSVHFYPRKDEVDKALEALAVYEAVGKPLVIEEMFPLSCSTDELLEFIDQSSTYTDGWISFYWGTTIEEYEHKGTEATIGDAITRQWLKHFRSKGREVLNR